MILPSASSPIAEPVVFEPETHTYRVKGKKIPSVSQILQKVGLTKNYEGVDNYYRDRGVATHLAIRYHLEGVLDPKSLDPAVEPHFRAFLAYQKDHPLGGILALEKPMGNLDLTWAGTPDIVTDTRLIDWKCSRDHDKVADLQGQAYKILAMANGLPILPFDVVELHDDASYAIFHYGDGFEQWSSVLDLYRWRTQRRASNPAPAKD
jgi:hypothetical protein